MRRWGGGEHMTIVTNCAEGAEGKIDTNLLKGGWVGPRGVGGCPPPHPPKGAELLKGALGGGRGTPTHLEMASDPPPP